MLAMLAKGGPLGQTETTLNTIETNYREAFRKIFGKQYR